MKQRLRQIRLTWFSCWRRCKNCCRTPFRRNARLASGSRSIRYRVLWPGKIFTFWLEEVCTLASTCSWGWMYSRNTVNMDSDNTDQFFGPARSPSFYIQLLMDNTYSANAHFRSASACKSHEAGSGSGHRPTVTDNLAGCWLFSLWIVGLRTCTSYIHV